MEELYGHMTRSCLSVFLTNHYSIWRSWPRNMCTNDKAKVNSPHPLTLEQIPKWQAAQGPGLFTNHWAGPTVGKQWGKHSIVTVGRRKIVMGMRKGKDSVMIKKSNVSQTGRSKTKFLKASARCFQVSRWGMRMFIYCMFSYKLELHQSGHTVMCIWK